MEAQHRRIVRNACRPVSILHTRYLIAVVTGADTGDSLHRLEGTRLLVGLNFIKLRIQCPLAVLPDHGAGICTMIQCIIAHGLLARIRVLHEIVIHGIGAVLVRILRCQLNLIHAGQGDGIGTALFHCLCSLHIGAGSDVFILLFIFFLVKPLAVLFRIVIRPAFPVGFPVVVIIVCGLCSIELCRHRKILGLQGVVQKARLPLGQENLAVDRKLCHIHGPYPCIVTDEANVIYRILLLRFLQRVRKVRKVVFTLRETHELRSRLHQRLNGFLAFRIGKLVFCEGLGIGQGRSKARPGIRGIILLLIPGLVIRYEGLQRIALAAVRIVILLVILLRGQCLHGRRNLVLIVLSSLPAHLGLIPNLTADGNHQLLQCLPAALAVLLIIGLLKRIGDVALKVCEIRPLLKRCHGLCQCLRLVIHLALRCGPVLPQCLRRLDFCLQRLIRGRRPAVLRLQLLLCGGQCFIQRREIRTDELCMVEVQCQTVFAVTKQQGQCFLGIGNGIACGLLIFRKLPCLPVTEQSLVLHTVKGLAAVLREGQGHLSAFNVCQNTEPRSTSLLRIQRNPVNAFLQRICLPRRLQKLNQLFNALGALGLGPALHLCLRFGEECHQRILLLLGKPGLCGNVVFQIVNLAHGCGILVILQRVFIYLLRIHHPKNGRLTIGTAAGLSILCQGVHHRHIKANQITVLSNALIGIGVVQFHADLGTAMCRVRSLVGFPLGPACLCIHLVSQILCLHLIFTVNIAGKDITAIAERITEMYSAGQHVQFDLFIGFLNIGILQCKALIAGGRQQSLRCIHNGYMHLINSVSQCRKVLRFPAIVNKKCTIQIIAICR